MDSTTSIARSASRFFSGTLLSRGTGLAREMVMAALFGATPEVAAFWMAYRFSHLMRRIFGEGALHASFIPHFESLRAQDPAKAAQFFVSLKITLALFLLGLIVAAELCLLPFSHNHVVHLTMLMLPSLPFICLFALNSALLNCEKRYFFPSAAPACLNVVWIGGALLFADIELVARTIVLAFGLQWAITLPFVWHYAKGQTQLVGSREIARMLAPFALMIVGISAVQFNTAIDSLFARAADPSGPAYLWYAIRLQQLPLALFGVGLTSALLPPLSRAGGEAPQFVRYALSRTIKIMLPITLGIFLLGGLSVRLLFGRGAFGAEDVVATTHCLWVYGTALVPSTLVMLLSACSYARKEYTFPTLLTLGSVGMNVALNALFVYGMGWGAISIALATTICATLQSLALVRKEFAHHRNVDWNRQ